MQKKTLDHSPITPLTETHFDKALARAVEELQDAARDLAPMSGEKPWQALCVSPANTLREINERMDLVISRALDIQRSVGVVLAARNAEESNENGTFWNVHPPLPAAPFQGEAHMDEIKIFVAIKLDSNGFPTSIRFVPPSGKVKVKSDEIIEMWEGGIFVKEWILAKAGNDPTKLEEERSRGIAGLYDKEIEDLLMQHGVVEKGGPFQSISRLTPGQIPSSRAHISGKLWQGGEKEGYSEKRARMGGERLRKLGERLSMD